jgi:hypothetical protein
MARLKVSHNDHVDSMLQSVQMWTRFALENTRLIQEHGDSLGILRAEATRYKAHARELLTYVRTYRALYGDVPGAVRVLP